MRSSTITTFFLLGLAALGMAKDTRNSRQPRCNVVESADGKPEFVDCVSPDVCLLLFLVLPLLAWHSY